MAEDRADHERPARITKGADPQIDADPRRTSTRRRPRPRTSSRPRRTSSRQTGDALRGKLDKLDGVIANTESITQKIDDDKGTLGRLVNDPAIADNVEAITEDAKGFLGTLFGLKAYVGLRSEYNVVRRARAPLRLGRAPHAPGQVLPDRAREGPARRLPRGHADVRSDRRSEQLGPQARVIEDKVRFTFQFAKRFGWLTLRYGIKESTGGIGADADLRWCGRGLRLQADVFDATFDQLPARQARRARSRCSATSTSSAASTSCSTRPTTLHDRHRATRTCRSSSRRSATAATTSSARCCGSTTRISRRCSPSAARRSPASAAVARYLSCVIRTRAISSRSSASSTAATSRTIALACGAGRGHRDRPAGGARGRRGRAARSSARGGCGRRA